MHDRPAPSQLSHMHIRELLCKQSESPGSGMGSRVQLAPGREVNISFPLWQLRPACFFPSSGSASAAQEELPWAVTWGITTFSSGATGITLMNYLGSVPAPRGAGQGRLGPYHWSESHPFPL